MNTDQKLIYAVGGAVVVLGLLFVVEWTQPGVLLRTASDGLYGSSADGWPDDGDLALDDDLIEDDIPDPVVPPGEGSHDEIVSIAVEHGDGHVDDTSKVHISDTTAGHFESYSTDGIHAEEESKAHFDATSQAYEEYHIDKTSRVHDSATTTSYDLHYGHHSSSHNDKSSETHDLSFSGGHDPFTTAYHDDLTTSSHDGTSSESHDGVASTGVHDGEQTIGVGDDHAVNFSVDHRDATSGLHDTVTTTVHQDGSSSFHDGVSTAHHSSALSQQQHDINTTERHYNIESSDDQVVEISSEPTSDPAQVLDGSWGDNTEDDSSGMFDLFDL